MDDYHGMGGSYIVDPKTGKRVPAKPEQPAPQPQPKPADDATTEKE